MTIYKSKFKESSLSRIWQHITNPERSFGVISAYLDIFTDSENIQRHDKLEQVIREYGFGFVEQKSGYTYLHHKTLQQNEAVYSTHYVPTYKLQLSKTR